MTHLPSIAPRLPLLTLPLFDGSSDWRQFWSLFTVVIDHQPISDEEKLIYLLNALHGQALALVEGYDISTAAYSHVKMTLEEEYGDNGMEITRLYSSFHDLPKSEETTASAHRTVQSLSMITRQLISLGEKIDCGAMETAMLRKLPRFLLERVLRAKKERGLTLTSLLDYLSNEIALLRQVDELNGCPAQPATTHYSALTRQERGWSTRPVYPCKFCGGAHSVLLCPMDYSQRKENAMEKKLCIACLRPSHPSTHCPSTQPCRLCSSPDHHSALCPPPSSLAKKPPERVSPAVIIDHDDDVILLTQDLQIVNPRSGAELRSTVFFDNGAQKSFIREDLAQSLNLVAIDKCRMDINAFGNHQDSFMSHVYNVQLLQKDGQLVDILVHSTPRMEMLLSGIATRDQEKRDPTRRTVSPGILIGSDRFWDLIHSRGPLLPSGLRSINTVFGRMVTGSTSTASTSVLPRSISATAAPVTVARHTTASLSIVVPRLSTTIAVPTLPRLNHLSPPGWSSSLSIGRDTSSSPLPTNLFNASPSSPSTTLSLTLGPSESTAMERDTRSPTLTTTIHEQSSAAATSLHLLSTPRRLYDRNISFH